MTHTGIILGVTIDVVGPISQSPYLKGPWLLIGGPGGSSLATPPLTRGSASALRALADEIDAAWVKMDNRAKDLPDDRQMMAQFGEG